MYHCENFLNSFFLKETLMSRASNIATTREKNIEKYTFQYVAISRELKLILG